jgi:hypothetical protein
LCNQICGPNLDLKDPTIISESMNPEFYRILNQIFSPFSVKKNRANSG